MNGRVAGCLRGTVYGEFSRRGTEYSKDHDGAVRCEGRRKVYLTLKKNNRPQALGDQFSEPIHRLKSKGKRRPRWLFPEKGDQ